MSRFIFRLNNLGIWIEGVFPVFVGNSLPRSVLIKAPQFFYCWSLVSPDSTFSFHRSNQVVPPVSPESLRTVFFIGASASSAVESMATVFSRINFLLAAMRRTTRIPFGIHSVVIALGGGRWVISSRLFYWNLREFA